MKQEHHPEQLKNVHKGVNKHISDSVAADNEDGYVNESLNTSPNIPGYYGARKKIDGETILYENTDGLEGYVNLAGVAVMGDIVELWGGETDGLIRINGVVRCQSTNLPLRDTDKIIVDVNDSVIGGEIYVTNRRTAPFILSVIDMISPADPNDFFDNFDIDKYAVNLKTPLNRMAFIECVALGGGVGVPVGAYSYSVAYVTNAGDRTNWCQETPVIPVPFKNQKSENYPTSRIFGADANTNIPSGFGVKLKFRVCNEYNFDYIEIKRTPYNLGAGINFTPTQEIIARLDITPNQIEVITFIDGKDNNLVPSIPLAPDQTLNVFSEIESAQALHYKNRRLHLLNVSYASRELSVEFTPGSISGNVADPYIHKIYKEGHSDPYNAAYYKSHMRGEKRSFAFGGFDGMGGAGLAMKIEDLQNYQFPERRNELSAQTDDLSFTNGRGVATASTVESNAGGRCHEVFDIADAQDRGVVTPHNIATEGGKAGTSYNAEDIGYKPLRPTSLTDPSISDHESRISESVDKEGHVGSDEVNYNPQGFSPDYYSLGLAIHGVESMPSWVKSFSILQSEPAQRVIAQGIGVYAMTEEGEGGSSSVKKERKKVWFYSSDINVGAVSLEIIQDLITNPRSYSVQLVSPLGYFSEVYHGDADAFSDDAQIDFISFARCLNNEESVNPGITTGYTKFGAWRNTLLGTNPAGSSTDKIFDILSVSKISEGRGEYYEIEIDAYIYDTYYTGGGREFIDDDVKAWHEPFYIINIIQNAKSIPDSNIMTLTSTGFYQKLSSLIGVSNGTDNQNFELVDERYEDCCVDFYSSTKTGDNSYLFIVDAAGNEEVWMDVTYKSDAARNAILSAMSISGEVSTSEYDSVVGVYRHEVVNDRFYSIKFERFNGAYDLDLFVPNAESKIFVKYDIRKPLKVFGGDVFIGESIFAPLDREIVKTGTESGENNCFKLNVGMPYYKFIQDVDYFIVKNADGTGENIQDATGLHLSQIRQWCVMFTSETRSPIHLKYGNAFPAVHYVMRPIDWNQKNLSANFAGNEGIIHNRYRDDYPGEEFLWGFGGFRFEEKVNSDYSSNPVSKFFSRPEVAFEEETEYPTRDHYSALRPIHQKNAPGVRSFPPLNIFDLDDKQGEIKFGASLSAASDTMYVFTEKGIVELLIGKNVLQDATGGIIGYLVANNIVQREEWKSRVIGVKNDLWQTIRQNDKNQLLFLSNEGMKLFDGSNLIMDISEGYRNELMHIVKYGSTSRLSSMYKIKDKEYWLKNGFYGSIGGENGFPTVRVFCDNEDSPAKGDWIGKFGFGQFDGFLYEKTRVYGFKDMETYELLNGTLISGEPIESYVDIFFGKVTNKEKEFIRFMIESDVKPERIEFYIDDILQCSVDMSNIKDYGTFEQFIPRRDLGVSSNRDRLQHNFVKMRIVHNLEQDFVLRTASLQYKLLK